VVAFTHSAGGHQTLDFIPRGEAVAALDNWWVKGLETGEN